MIWRKCIKCKLPIEPGCMLTTGVCVFCHYKIKSWDCNGKKVTKDQAIMKIIKLKESKKMKDYIKMLHKSINYYWSNGQSIPVENGFIFSILFNNTLRYFDMKDYYEYANRKRILSSLV